MAGKFLGVYPINCDLQKERASASFPVNELTYFLEGDAEKTFRRKELEKLFYESEEFEFSSTPVDYMNYNEIYEEALAKASKMYFTALNLEDPREMLAVGEAFHHEATPLLLHFIMFLPALLGHATEEQLDRWLPDAIELKIIGTYAQTELGHGTFIRGLETRATYDAERQEFILESPSLKSIKWWPGGLGKTANWAIVLAQLYTEGKCRGVHPFMVQLRDGQSHEPLKGIVVGEIGPKMGLKAADNGYLQLNSVRIPRDHMLMKNAKVEPDGTYIEPKSDKLTYGTMVFVRVVIIDMVAFNLARAATITTRYSAVRRQSEIEKGEGEVQILDYQAQQMKLFPAIALSHAFKAAFVHLMGIYKEVADDIELRGDLEQLGELHAMSSGLKAFCSEMAASAIETCRRAAGGHGYLLMSGLPRLYATTVAACTYEGENTVLYLQTARYLLKCLHPGTQLPQGLGGDGAHVTTTTQPELGSKVDGNPIITENGMKSKKSSKDYNYDDGSGTRGVTGSGLGNNGNFASSQLNQSLYSPSLGATFYLRTDPYKFTVNTDLLHQLLNQAITLDPSDDADADADAELGDGDASSSSIHLDGLAESKSDVFIERACKIIAILLDLARATSRRLLITARDQLVQLTTPSSERRGGSNNHHHQHEYQNNNLAASNKIGQSPIMSPEKAWIASQIDLIRGAKAHLLQLLLSKYITWVTSAPESIRLVLCRLALLLFYTIVTEQHGDFIMAGMTQEQLNLIQGEIKILLQQIRPDAVALVDAFDFHDVVLMSTLGCYDGAVYERMFEMAKKSPLNQVDPHPAFMKHIHSLTRSKL